MVVYNIKDTSEWYAVTLAKRQLAWHREKSKDPALNEFFDFRPAIEKEESFIRSFFNSLKDRAA